MAFRERWQALKAQVAPVSVLPQFSATRVDGIHIPLTAQASALHIHFKLMHVAFREGSQGIKVSLTQVAPVSAGHPTVVGAMVGAVVGALVPVQAPFSKHESVQ